MKYKLKARLNNPKRPKKHGKTEIFLSDGPNITEEMKKKGWEKISHERAIKGIDYIYI